MHASHCTATRIAEDGVLAITVTTGEIREPAVAYDLRNEMLALAKEAGTPNLVIDARNLTFMGSVGFLAFLGIRRELPGQIVLCNLSPAVRDAFAVCRLIPSDGRQDAPFQTANSLEDALGLFRSAN